MTLADLLFDQEQASLIIEQPFLVFKKEEVKQEEKPSSGGPKNLGQMSEVSLNQLTSSLAKPSGLIH